MEVIIVQLLRFYWLCLFYCKKKKLKNKCKIYLVGNEKCMCAFGTFKSLIVGT